MSLNNSPEVYNDRIAVSELGKLAGPLLEAMKEWGIGKVDGSFHVRFCGIVRGKDGRTAVFLPLAVPDRSLSTAKLMMRTLARYGREASGREFAGDGEAGNPGALAVIKLLANDFVQHGLFHERQRVHARNNGKPDWKRTVTHVQALPSREGEPVYIDIATSRAVDSHETLLAQVQAVVMSEIIEQHGWWIDGVSTRRQELRWQKQPYQKRSLWPVLLEALLPRLYSARSINLAKLIGYYLRDCRGSAGGTFVFGIEDFHTVWEAMLRQTLLNVESGWNKRLPRAVYETASGDTADAPERGMLTDIILRDDLGFTIIDAKYYQAISDATVPGWPDIVKQMFYELALRSVVGSDKNIRNCFVFPAAENSSSGYQKVALRQKSNGVYIDEFPKISCYYLTMTSVMDSYCHYRSDTKLPP